MSKDRSLSTAIQILTILDKYSGSTTVNSEFLATSLCTNAGLVRRTLSKLSKAGLVETTLGKHGGTVLNRPSKQISLDEVYQAINDGPIFKSFDKEPYPGCPVSCQIGDILTDVYSEIEIDLKNKMRKIKLSEVTAKIK
jgi:DNA-binding IscR family transcriptional regulator